MGLQGANKSAPLGWLGNRKHSRAVLYHVLAVPGKPLSAQVQHTHAQQRGSKSNSKKRVT